MQDVSLFIGTGSPGTEPARQFVVWGVLVVAALLALFVLVVLITAASRQGRRIKPDSDLRPERDLGPDPWIEAGRRLIANLGSSMSGPSANDETDVHPEPPPGTDPADDVEFRDPGDEADPDMDDHDGDDDDPDPEPRR